MTEALAQANREAALSTQHGSTLLALRDMQMPVPQLVTTQATTTESPTTN